MGTRIAGLFDSARCSSAVVIVCAVILGAFFSTSTSGQGAMANVVPLTVTMVEVDADGKELSTVVEATRSDGSMVDVITHGRFDSPSRRVRFVSGKDIWVAENSHSKCTIYDPSRAPGEWLRAAKVNCVRPAPAKDSLLGVETIDGYRAAKVSLFPEKVSWFALDYGCAEIHYTVQISKTAIKTFRLKSLVPGEPAAELFIDPLDYKEVPPSRLFGSDAKQDAYYYAHRPPQ